MKYLDGKENETVEGKPTGPPGGKGSATGKCLSLDDDPVGWTCIRGSIRRQVRTHGPGWECALLRLGCSESGYNR